MEVFIHKSFFEKKFMRHYDFSEKQSRVHVTRQTFVMRENLLVTHDILSTIATFSSLAEVVGRSSVYFIHGFELVPVYGLRNYGKSNLLTPKHNT